MSLLSLLPDAWRFGKGTGGRRSLRPRLELLEKRELLATSLSLPIHLDFGTSQSPVAPGYIGVPLAAYSSSVGYGWSSTSGMFAADRGGSNPLTRDVHRSTDKTFLVNLPNGIYDITPTLGDGSYLQDTITLWGEGKQLASGLSIAAGQFIQPTYRVQIADGQLDLRINGIGGANDYFSITGLDIVPVAGPLTANAGPDLVVLAGSAVRFIGSATGGSGLLSYQWDFGDGATATGTPTPTHSYATSGAHTVTLTATDALGNTSCDTAAVTVQSAPNIGWPRSGTVGAAIQFAVANPAVGLTYSWNFGDGKTAVGAAVSHAYTAVGTYTTTLTAKDSSGFSTTASTTAAVDWTSNLAASNPLGNWNVQSSGQWGMQNVQTLADPTGQFGTILRVTYPAGSASPAVNRNYGAPLGGAQWLGNLGMAPADSLRLSYSVRFANNFNFVLGGKLPGLFGGTQISGGQIPDGTNGFSTRFMWRTGGAGEVYAYLPTSTIYGTSLGRGSWTFKPGQWYRLEQEVVLNTPGQANGSVKVWVDGKLVLTATGLTFRTVNTLKIEGIFFSTFFGGNDPTWETPVATYADFANFAVSKTSLPVANAGPNLTAFEGQALAFAGTVTGGTGPLSYRWDFGDGTFSTGSLNSTHTFADNGIYTVTLTVTDALGLFSRDTATVTVLNVAPTANIGGPYSGTVGSAIKFSGSATDPSPLDTTAGFTYLWDFGDGSTASGATPSHTFSAAGVFTVTLTVKDKDGGVSKVTTTATIV